MEPSAQAEESRVLKCLSNRHVLRQMRLMLIVAHPDDEVIGAGARLPELRSSMFIHVTTGAAARCAGVASRRSSELSAALGLAGLSNSQLHPVGLPDQSLSRMLLGLTKEFRSKIAAQKPDAILTHPYEGGHPDHDAIAFAVHCACRATAHPPPIVEMAFYHQGPHGIRTGEFLPDGNVPILSLSLSTSERDLKRSLLDCFPSQTLMLRHFQLKTEKFRIAPAYDFTLPPHTGRLFYENFDWGIRSGLEWRALAHEALWQLEMES